MKQFRILFIAMLCFLPAAAAGAMPADTLRVLQWNVWQEGTMVPGGKKAIVDEIARLKPDFVTLSEVRNYHGRDYTAALVDSLARRGLTYYSFSSYDSGLLSRLPIADTLTVFPENGDHGSIYRLRADDGRHKYAVYTAHLDYQDDAYYNVRGYDGSTWRPCAIPATAAEVLERNDASQRHVAVRRFIDAACTDIADGYLVILGGDFNEPSHRDWTEATAGLYDHHGLVVPWTVTTLLEEAGMTDTWRAVWPDPLTHPGFTYPADNADVAVSRLTWAPEADERERIDYIFTGPYTGLEIAGAEIFGPRGCIVRSQRVEQPGADPFIAPLGTWPTDHKGLLVTLIIR